MTMKMQTKLQQDLKRFGLNPQDWVLRTGAKAQVQVHHREDADFKFKGRIAVQREKIYFQDLTLYSL